MMKQYLALEIKNAIETGDLPDMLLLHAAIDQLVYWEQAIEELEKDRAVVWEWLRQPDHAGHFGTTQLLAWVEKRPFKEAMPHSNWPQEPTDETTNRDGEKPASQFVPQMPNSPCPDETSQSGTPNEVEPMCGNCCNWQHIKFDAYGDYGVCEKHERCRYSDYNDCQDFKSEPI